MKQSIDNNMPVVLINLLIILVLSIAAIMTVFILGAN